MYQIEMQTSRLDPLFDTYLAAAGDDQRLFFDPKWQVRLSADDRCMTTAGKIINDAKPSEALMEVHISSCTPRWFTLLHPPCRESS